MSRNHETAWSDPRLHFFGDENLDDLDAGRYLTSPAFENHCKHHREEFVGRIRYHVNGQIKEADVYVHGTNTQHVCIRTSSEPSDYYSCGTVLDMIMSATRHPDNVLYQAAACLIDELFICVFIRK